jgi:hypothetical protein
MAISDYTVAPELDALAGRPRNNPRPKPADALDMAKDGPGSTTLHETNLYEDAGEMSIAEGQKTLGKRATKHEYGTDKPEAEVAKTIPETDARKLTK